MPGVGLSASLLMGTRSLANQRQALEVIGHNLANVNTPGAARQRVDLVQDLTFSSASIIQGLGARVDSVTSLRNELLDLQVLRQGSLSGLHDQRATLGGLLEQALGENFSTGQASQNPGISSLTGIQNSLNSFFDAWQSLADNPSSNLARAEVLTRGESLAADLNNAYQRIVDIKGGLFPEAGNTATQVNSIASEIASLNQQIARAEVGLSQQANDLRDRRQLLLEEMSKLVNIRVTPNAANNDMVDVSLADNSTVRLVNGVAGGGQAAGGNDSWALSVNAAFDPATNSGLRILATPSTGAPVLLGAGQPTEGKLGGLVNVSTAVIGDGHAAGTTTVAGRLNQLAASVISAVNTLHADPASWDAEGDAGVAFFSGTGANNIGVAITDPLDVSAAGGAAFPGVLDGSIATTIAGLRGNSTLGAFHRQTVTELGLTVQQAQRDSTAQGLVAKQILAERESVSGISVDEEMSNLVLYQRAFEASARFVNVIDQLLQTVTNLGRG